jgi:ribosome biogenesis GTPase
LTSESRRTTRPDRVGTTLDKDLSMTFELAALGWDDRVAAGYAPFDRADAYPGRVSRLDRGVCTVLTRYGPDRVSLGGGVLAAAASTPESLPCAGDWVVVRRWPDRRSTVEAVLPRRTALTGHLVTGGTLPTNGSAVTGGTLPTGGSADTGGTLSTGRGVPASSWDLPGDRPLAANIDVVAVLLRPSQAASGAVVERLVALAVSAGAEPVLVLGRRQGRPEPGVRPRRVVRLAPALPVYRVGSGTDDGLAGLRALTTGGRSLALLGTSAVGRSALITALTGAPVLGVGGRVAGYRPGAGSVLVPVPGGGVVIDTPPVAAGRESTPPVGRRTWS